MSLPSVAEVEHADWSSLQRICADLGLNPKGRSAVVRMRVADYVRRRVSAPTWRPAREHQAALLTRLGFPELSERVWESTIQLDAPAPWIGLGHAQLAGGFLGEAAKSFARAAQMGDPSADLHRAEALAASGDLEGAARGLDAYLASRPADLRALAMRADFLARAGFLDEALKVLQSAVELHPDVPGLARTLGIALLKAGRHAQAADALHVAARRDPQDIDAAVNRGAALLLGGRTREAIEVLRESLELDSKRADALNNLGVAYLTMGQPRSASVNLKRAAKHLESPRILLNLGRVLEDAGKQPDAYGVYDQVLRLRPRDPEALAGQRRLAPSKKPRRRPRKVPKKAQTRSSSAVRSKRMPPVRKPRPGKTAAEGSEGS